MRTSSPRGAGRRRVALLSAAALLVPALATVTAAAATAQTVPQPAPDSLPEPPSKAEIGGLQVENAFVSSTGWVKPGDSYPSRLILTNPGEAAVSGVEVSLADRRGMTWTDARAAVGTASVTGGEVSWTVPSVPAATTIALVLEATADTLEQEPTIVWRDISSIAEVSVGGGAATELASHGPKVIPPEGGYETARYGDRPFPVVPVDYFDSKHTSDHPADLIDGVINDPENPSSTFNLFQEMSFGQLYPNGTIGSLDAKGAEVTDEDALVFTTIDPESANTCTGVTTVDPGSGEPSPLYTQRVSEDGWYQLPGQAQYYGADANGSALVGALAGVGALQAIDSGCGPTAKLAYDAAVVADPDIDYNDFDTDKDGVVDFFEVIFEGCGGNGASQLSVAAGCPPGEAPDNVWPHSSSLEFSYTNPETGLTGYTSKDRLKDLEGNLLFYTDDSYTVTTTDETEFPAFVRVGPYNVNPETSLDFASVISHEYGHSLGLPDYYSTGSRETYGDYNLMATDKGHHMDIIGKKEMGWIVPKVLAAGETRSADEWRESKVDTGEIEWISPGGEPYTLSGANGDYGIHNAEAYVAALPGRQLLDPAKIQEGASGKQVWYSRQGNDFGCPPNGGHNLDFAIPGLEDVEPGTPITMTFKTFFDIEWDYDYGFVLLGQPGEQGKVTYTSQESENGYTTPATQNPNANSCQAAYGNGLTGTNASYDNGTAPVDRVAGNYPDGPFTEDQYDVSELAGQEGGVVRFTYATDPGLARLGWVIDDLKIVAGEEDGEQTVLFESDFEDGDGGVEDPRVYNGGCKEDLSTSGGVCTEGWSYVAAGTPSELEHSYLMEMRDRSGFDIDGREESDRGPTEFEPGLLLTYTDEAHGYGNVGTDNPPAQSPLDSVPEPEEDAPNLNDATFNPAQERSTFSDASTDPHFDNYGEPTRDESKDEDGDGTQPWTFDYSCLGFTVTEMSGETDNTVDKYDLVGDVDFTMGKGCARFNYGVAGKPPVLAPRGITNACPEGEVPANTGADYDGNTHDLAIDCMIWKQIANGVTSAKDYDPAVPVNRERMASFVARLITAAGGELPAPGEDDEGFSDEADPAHQENVDKLAAAGIVGGKGDGTYAPKELVTRGQMATFLVRAYEYVSDGALVSQGDYFADDNGTTHEANINKAAAGGFTAGRANGDYEPGGPVLRDQMASFLARTLDLLVEEANAAPEPEPEPSGSPSPSPSASPSST